MHFQKKKWALYLLSSITDGQSLGTFFLSPGTNVPAGTLTITLTGWGLGRGYPIALLSLGGVRDEAPEAGEFPEGFFASKFLDTPLLLMRYTRTQQMDGEYFAL